MVRKVIYSMGVSLDGFIAGPGKDLAVGGAGLAATFIVRYRDVAAR